MSTSALIFSKDRAAQLDLLLRSVTCNAPNLLGSVHVLWKASTDQYRNGYDLCMEEHPNIGWTEEHDFMEQTLEQIDMFGDFGVFFTDDSLIYRPFEELTTPADALNRFPGILCFSLRLGLHTGQCYPLRRLQGLPAFERVDDYLVWNWRTGDADFGYAGSLDGHVFRKFDLLDMLDGTRPFYNPNHLEEILVRETQSRPETLAACHLQSHLVSLPVNQVNDSHPNRYGEMHFHDPEALNRLFLEGKRILLSSVKADRVTAAHTEMELTVA